ncbi:MAG: DUF99 family protein [Candidatus Bathyarchaeota archaeon]|nr:MAG: DUF99 family protein [Candidatus Bathyarchaeota archaeon]
MHENIVRIRCVKPEIRVLGVDDGVFVPHAKSFAVVVGVVYRGGYWLDGVMRTEVEIDGFGATEKIASMISASTQYHQLRAVMLSGVTFAGFNVVDIKKLFERVRLPVIAVMREKPRFNDIKKAIQNLPEYSKRWEAMENAGEIIEVHTRGTEQAVYIQIAGISEKDAKKVVKSTSTRSNIPEPLRVAHIIASGLTQPKENV